jgi:FtsP/CotA-like multicopper oxidase with cupredoxin domain
MMFLSTASTTSISRFSSSLIFIRTAVLVLLAGGALSLERPLETLRWKTGNRATIEFCSSSSVAYGYKIPDADGGGPCKVVGPTIRMTPGVTYYLQLVNTLDPSAPSSVTNIHTHGLHISGDGPGDDITRFVEPGQCMVYKYQVPSDHNSGTFWYHSHKHENTNVQVKGGAIGFVIIDRVGEGPSKPEREHLLMFSNGVAGKSALINGLLSEKITIEANKWQYGRIANVHPDGRSATIYFPNCEAKLMATDGVWLPKATKPAINQITLTGSSRADILFRCNQSSGFWFGGTTGSPIVAINVVNAAYPNEDDTQNWAPFIPSYLSDIPANAVTNYYSFSMSAAAINNQKWDINKPLATFSTDNVHEWTLDGTGAHPFHLHVWHMVRSFLLILLMLSVVFEEELFLRNFFGVQ